MLPQNGLYLDMDGSTNEAGAIETKETFPLEPGEYILQFQVCGNPGGPRRIQWP